jgi:putative hydrolase of the HAD superfamily
VARQLDAIFFDLDDTLFSTSQFAERARRASVNAMCDVGLRMDAEEVMQELREVVVEFSSNFDQHFDKLLARIPKRHYKGVNPAMIVAAGVIAYHETKVRELAPYEDAAQLVRRLANTTLIRGVITAGWEVKQAEKLLRIGLYKYLTPNAVFISDQIGINKPNPKIYRRACSDLNLRPAHCIYVGDNPRHDIDPPNQIGMITVRHRRDGRYRDEEGESAADYEIRDFHQLGRLLEADFDLDLSGARSEAPAASPPDSPAPPASADAC